MPHRVQRVEGMCACRTRGPSWRKQLLIQKLRAASSTSLGASGAVAVGAPNEVLLLAGALLLHLAVASPPLTMTEPKDPPSPVSVPRRAKRRSRVRRLAFRSTESIKLRFPPWCPEPACAALQVPPRRGRTQEQSGARPF